MIYLIFYFIKYKILYKYKIYSKKFLKEKFFKIQKD